jgi:hypothetical protein
VRRFYLREPEAALRSNRGKASALKPYKQFDRTYFQGKTKMTVVYIEARPKGRREGSLIADYVVEDHAHHSLTTFNTQLEAIEWARKNGHSAHVARVRHLNDKKNPDHWRKV